MKKRFALLFVIAFLLATTITARADTQLQATQSRVVVVTFNGALTPVWQGYLERGIFEAESLKADLIVIELNTPGGSVDTMNKLVEQILASPIPIAVYVSPAGAMAASAGTMITLAGHISAMAPGTAIGAASPVGLQGEDISTTEELKTKEILKATARSLAERRGDKAVQLAESTIENARAASATEAKNAGLVDFIAKDLDDLLKQVNGKSVTLSSGTVKVNTISPAVYPLKTTFIEDILSMLTNPNIIFLLLSIGVQAILIEISSPGGWVAGFIGAVFLAFAVYGLGILPVNWFGFIFLILAFVLFILDIKAPTHGALTAAGTGSFIAGSLILFNSARVPAFAHVSVLLVVSMGTVLGLSFFAVVMLAVRAMRTPVVTGRESMVGKEGYALDEFDRTGIVHVAGEDWSAVLESGEPPVQAHDRVIVTRVEGVRMVVKKKGDAK